MHALHPAAFWLLPLALAPFLLRRPTPVPRRIVSALHLWPAATATTPPAPRLRRFRPTPRTLVQALLLAVIVLAIAEPVISPARADLVLLVDRSASMGARNGEDTVLASALAAALAALDTRGTGTTAGAPRVRVIEAGPEPVDRGVATGRTLRERLGAIAPEPGGADLAAANARAAALEPGVPVWVVSDHDVIGVARAFTARTTSPNLGLVALTASARPEGLDLAAQVVNTAAVPATGQLTFTTTGSQTASMTLTLAAGETRTVFHPTEGRHDAVTASLVPAGPDALAADNIRAAVPARALRVLVTADAGPAMRHAIAALDDVAIVTREADIVVCAVCPEPPTARGLLHVGAEGHAGAPAPVEIAPTVHPVTEGLAGLPVAAAPTGMSAQGDVLARAGDAPLVTAGLTATGRRVQLLASPASLAGTPFLPVLVANAIDWLGGRDNPRAIEAGAPLRWWAGPGATATLTGPDGRPREARVADGWLLSTDTMETGLYTVGGTGLGGLIAVAPPAGESMPHGPDDLGPHGERAEATSEPDADAARALAPWLVALALLLLGVDAWLAGVPGARAHAACAVLLLLTVARVPTGRAPLTIVALLDRSDSVAPRQQLAAARAMAAWSRASRAGDATGLITFAARPRLRRAPGAAPLAETLDVEPDTGDTNIADAIQAAMPLLPRGGTGRLVLVSDGRATAGDTLAAADAAAAAGIAIDTVAVPPRSALGLVRLVTAPPEARVGEGFDVGVDVSGPAGRVMRVVLTGDGQARPVDVPIGPGGSGHAEVRVRATTAGLVVYRAHPGEEDDPGAPGAAVTVLGPPRALVVRPALRPSTQATLPASMPADVVTPASMPATLAALAAYQLVVLDGAPGDALAPGAGAALARWVTGGGGLAVLGTETSLPAGGYADAALDTLLPVDLRVSPGTRAETAATVVALDTSGSMADMAGGLQKIEAARQAARQVARVLAPDDPFGVIAFDAQARAAVPLTRAGTLATSGSGLDAALAALTPRGATRLAPAVALAAEWLGGAGVARRHLLIVSDGRSTATDLGATGEAAAAAGLTVSVIAIGTDADRAGLDALARRTGGRTYYPAQLADLPRLAARDVVASRGGATVRETTALRAARPHPLLRGLDLTALPPVGGYLVAAPRPSAEPVLDSALGDPVLIAGRAGLGRVLVLTTDLQRPAADGGGAPLGASAAGRAILTQAWQWASRRDRADGRAGALDERAAGARLVVGFEQPPAGAPEARLVDADGMVTPVALRPDSPRLFSAPVTPRGAVTRVEVTAGDARVLRALVRPADRERTGAPLDDATLATLSGRTGGRRLTADANPFDAPRPLGWRTLTPWPALLALVAALALSAGLPRHSPAAPEAAA